MTRHLVIAVIITYICMVNAAIPTRARPIQKNTAAPVATAEFDYLAQDNDVADNDDSDLDENQVKNTARQFDPSEDQNAQVIEQYDRRNANGTYEYKFVLSNGITRYEKSYWMRIGRNQFLAVKGYFSHRFPNGQYFTTFYAADNNGYRVDNVSYSNSPPILPDSLKVPDNEVILTTTVPPSRRTKALIQNDDNVTTDEVVDVEDSPIK